MIKMRYTKTGSRMVPGKLSSESPSCNCNFGKGGKVGFWTGICGKTGLHCGSTCITVQL